MTLPKLKVWFTFFSYGGTGGVACCAPAIRRWWGKTSIAAYKNDRISSFGENDLTDTPITMTRNASVEQARQQKADVLVMVDSDHFPDYLVGHDPQAKPFFESSFEFLLKRHEQGPVVIAAPYCGPPPHENVYIFRWLNFESDDPNNALKLDQYGREEAAMQTGIGNVAACPTGLIMWDMRCFDLIEPPYFYYEYADKYQIAKVSTEDVTATRDVSLAGCRTLGYNPLFCNWDAWAGHYKPKCVGKPKVTYAQDVARFFEKARDLNLQRGVKTVDVGADGEEGVSFRAPPQKWVKSKRKIGDRQVTSLGFATADADLEALQEVVDRAAARFIAPRVVELGSWVGESAVAILDAEPSAILHCVDTFRGSANDSTHEIAEQFGEGAVRAMFDENTKGLELGVIEATTLQAAECWEDTDGIHLLYVDAGHTDQEVTADLESWLPHMHPEGFVAGHDYGERFPGVKAAVDRMFGQHVQHIRGTEVWFVDMAKATVLVGANGKP